MSWQAVMAVASSSSSSSNRQQQRSIMCRCKTSTSSSGGSRRRRSQCSSDAGTSRLPMWVWLYAHLLLLLPLPPQPTSLAMPQPLRAKVRPSKLMPGQHKAPPTLLAISTSGRLAWLGWRQILVTGVLGQRRPMGRPSMCLGLYHPLHRLPRHHRSAAGLHTLLQLVLDSGSIPTLYTIRTPACQPGSYQRG